MTATSLTQFLAAAQAQTLATTQIVTAPRSATLRGSDQHLAWWCVR